MLYLIVAVYGVVVLSSRMVWHLSSPQPEARPRAIGFVNGNLSKERGPPFDWPGPMWGRPIDRSPFSTGDAGGHTPIRPE